jgi:hypothetical protein
MSDTDTPAAPAPSAELAPAPAADGRYEGGGGNTYSATPDTRASLDALSANRQWSEDFSGANGRESQRHAVTHKSALIHELHGPAEQVVDVTDNRSDALKEMASSTDQKTREFADDLAPPANASEYSFQLEGAQSMDPDAYNAMNSEVSEIALSLGADVRTAKGVVEHIDRFLVNNPKIEPLRDANEVIAAVDKTFGAGNDVIERAKSMVQSIPEPHLKNRLLNTFERLDLSTTVFLMGKLAGLSRNRANG